MNNEYVKLVESILEESNKKMKVLVAFESSGAVRNAFRAKGHNAYSCDLLDSVDDSKYHIKGDAVETISSRRWDLVIAHPPCTHLAVSGSRHFAIKKADGRQQQGIDLFMATVDACENNAAKWCIENPVGIMSNIYRKPDQIIQPYMFGHNASKKTCLWLKNLPKLQPTKMIKGRMINGKERWANQMDSGQSNMTWEGKKEKGEIWRIRSKTYPGIAEAMANQWG